MSRVVTFEQKLSATTIQALDGLDALIAKIASEEASETGLIAEALSFALSNLYGAREFLSGAHRLQAQRWAELRAVEGVPQ